MKDAYFRKGSPQIGCGGVLWVYIDSIIWQAKGDHDLTFLCYHRGGHVYHEWPVLNWYQFDISCLFSCKLLIFTPLVILSWGDANMSRRIRRSYTSFSLGLTYRNLSIHCYHWGTNLSKPLIGILFNLARYPVICSVVNCGRYLHI